MTVTNDFLSIATSGGANVLSQVDYAAMTTFLDDGFSSGLVPSNQFNKVIRQSSVVSKMIGDFIVSQGLDALDDGNSSVLLENFSDAITALIAGAVTGEPTGKVSLFGGSSAPTGYLECDGTAISRTTYAPLFAVIGTAYGVGNGTTTFNLPDMRGEFARGWDHSRGIDYGRTLGSTQADEFKSHTHTTSVTDPGHTHNVLGTATLSGSDNNVYLPNTPNSGSKATTSATTGIGVSVNASSGGSETRPRNVSFMFIIKT
jgi:microcystin-dependent protein